ncbi:MAG TPA: HD-GYP domain-containing protein [Bryobacteraceae bacterium]|jgi:putative nucleotidyltransferase with HDIG domain
MRFRTRTFLLSFVPFALLLSASFWAIQDMVQATVRDGVRVSLRENHQSAAKLHARNELQNSRFLKIVGENAVLKAGLQLANANPSSADARLTVEDQVTELCAEMGFDLLLVSDAEGRAIAGVTRSNTVLVRMEPKQLPSTALSGLATVSGRVYQIASVPIDQSYENLGNLTIGELFDLSEFTTPALLLRDGRVIQSNLKGVSYDEIGAAMGHCNRLEECEVRLRGEIYVSVAMQSISLGNGYVLRTLQSLDAASGPVRFVLRRVFVVAAAAALLLALICGILSAKSIVGPISAIVEKLRDSAATGIPAEFHEAPASVSEIQELMESFNRAAGAVKDGRAQLESAYVQFIGSLAHALDARDQYTAGHSSRVSEISCAIARALCVEADVLEQIRTGALLHDIGKIGISDVVLQKPGKLTVEEFDIIKQHPTIGRHILEGVNGFEPYLDSVELHHENWDGTGYPHGLAGEAVPLAARIIHVADAYDAMTSDRPYRRGMTHGRAMSILAECSGTQFDPTLVDVFQKIGALPEGVDRAEDLLKLLTALEPEQARVAEVQQ